MVCYVDLIKWLDNISYGWFRAAVNSYQMSLHAMEKTLTFSEWRTFIDILSERNSRDGLIARALLQGQRRVSEVLGLTLRQIDFENNTISYRSKKGKSILVSYEASFMKELQEYVNETSKLRKDKYFVFLTRTGKKVTRLRVNYSFARVCELAEIKKISPDYLRGIYKMFVQQRYKETAIMQSKKARLEQSKIEAEKGSRKCNNEISR
jgi:integrase